MTTQKVMRRLLFAGGMMFAACPAFSQAPAKTVVATQNDLPRFTYPMTGTAGALLTADDAIFAAFAAKVGADAETVLARYDVRDRATLRDLLTVRMNLQALAGRNADAIITLAQIRALQDKPDAKLLSGLRLEAVLKARQQSGVNAGPAFDKAFATIYAGMLAPLPWTVVGNGIKEAKSSAQLLAPSLISGRVAANIEPAVATTHQLSSDLAWQLIGARAALKIALPTKATTVMVLTKIVAANSVQKPDIWTARDVTLTAADKLTPVTVAIWDSGVDLALYPGRVYTDPKPDPRFDPHGLAFDIESRPTHGNLYPLSAAEAKRYPAMLQDFKGFSDLTLSIDSSEADVLKAKLAALPADQAPAFLESLGFYGQYLHGTHVAGIASRGNPAIRLAAARLTFDWHNVPQKPTEELVRREVAAYQTYVDWFRTHGVRVVNMSWGGDAASYEDDLAKNGVGKDAKERQTIARKLFEIERDGLTKAIASAPDILFICSAGNSNADSGFDESIPAGIKLPNLLTVGAVDQAGDEASFTSYGATVLVDANGYQVPSLVPGGTTLRESGTSMASPNTVNLAAKLIALAPGLTPTRTIKLIVDGATPSADGRRHNIDPAKSVALLRDPTG